MSETNYDEIRYQMSEDHYKPPSAALSSIPAEMSELTRRRFRFRLIPTLLCAAISICLFVLLLVLTSIWFESKAAGAQRVDTTIDSTELVGVFAIGILSAVFAYAARCWYLSDWKLAMTTTLVAFLGLSTFVVVVVRDEWRRREQGSSASSIELRRGLTFGSD